MVKYLVSWVNWCIKLVYLHILLSPIWLQLEIRARVHQEARNAARHVQNYTLYHQVALFFNFEYFLWYALILVYGLLEPRVSNSLGQSYRATPTQNS